MTLSEWNNVREGKKDGIVYTTAFASTIKVVMVWIAVLNRFQKIYVTCLKKKDEVSGKIYH